MLLTGKFVPASEARAVGLIGHVVPDGDALDKAREIAEQIAENGPLAVQAVLKSMRATREMPEKIGLAYELEIGQPDLLDRGRHGGTDRVRREAQAELPGQVDAVDVEGLADLSRTLIDRLVSAKAPPDALARAAASITDATEEIDAYVPEGPRNIYEGFSDEW